MLTKYLVDKNRDYAQVLAELDSTNTVVWRWDSTPFGETLPDEDPDNNGIVFTYNLRFPGQYYDQESGLHYNYFRDYNPTTGRYQQSDPIGLLVEMNTYDYVFSDPLILLDIYGLAPTGKIDGNKIQAHKNYADPWPSKPHGHIYDKNQVVDKNGNIYNKSSKNKVGQLSKKGKVLLKDLFKKAGLLGIFITITDLIIDGGDIVSNAFAEFTGSSDVGIGSDIVLPDNGGQCQ